MKNRFFTILFVFSSLVYSQSKETPITKFSQELKNQGILIDVRTSEEFEAGHLEGAVNIDWFAEDFKDQLDSLIVQRDKKIYVYCQKGGRSAKAVKLIDSLGYGNVTDLSGGYENYISNKN